MSRGTRISENQHFEILRLAMKDMYLVIGGSGFLGRHIVEQLVQRKDNVAVFDIVQRNDDVPFYSGDISDQSQVASAIRKVRLLFFSFLLF